MPARLIVWIAVLGCAFYGAAPAAAAQPGGAAADRNGGFQPAVMSKANSAAAGSHRYESEGRNPTRFVAVMGAVAVPGVHALPTGNAMLSDVVKQAGGLTSQASGAVSVIRNARAVLESHASTGLRVHLQPGDVVIAAADDSAAPRIVPKSATATVPAELPVEIALVNLIPRPVVLKLRPRHASLTALVQLLGQHPNVARFVRIIGGGQSGRLRDGSVLVFDPRVLDPSRIPALPAPIVPETKAKAEIRPALHRGQQPIRQVQGTEQNRESGPFPAGPVLSTAPPSSLPKTAGDVPAAASPEPLRTAANNNEIPKPGGGVPAPVPPVKTAAANRDLIAEADRNEREATDSTASLDLVTLIITVFAVVGVLSAAGLLISMARRAIRGQTRTDTPARRRSRLDQLLHKELDIVIEPVSLPPGQAFFGRASGAGPQRNRIDDLHEASEQYRPHFETEADASSGDGRRSTGAQRQTFRRTDGPQNVEPTSPTASARRSASRVHEEELG